MFQFSRFAPAHYGFMCRSGRSQGLPHSEIAGSKPIRGSPTLIAAYHVLHRLSVPRHPPNALKSLDRSHYQCPSGLSDLGKEIQRMVTDVRKTYMCFDLPVVSGQASQPRLAAPQANPFIHDVKQQTLNALARRNLFCGRSGRMPVMSMEPKDWWSQTGSNRRPQACKASALPTELWPRFPSGELMVGLGRLELPTSRLSSARSNQLSYRPDKRLNSPLCDLKERET